MKQNIPNLCRYVAYNLTYTSQLSIYGGQPYRGCSAYIDLDDGGQLVFIGPPNGDYPPFSRETRSTVFTYYGGNSEGNTLTVGFMCSAPGGSYFIDDISLVGLEPVDDGS